MFSLLGHDGSFERSVVGVQLLCFPFRNASEFNLSKMIVSIQDVIERMMTYSPSQLG